MSTGTATGQTTSRRTTTPSSTTAATQTERSAANRLRATMAAVRLAFTWLGVRETLAPEQRAAKQPHKGNPGAKTIPLFLTPASRLARSRDSPAAPLEEAKSTGDESHDRT